MLTVGMVSSGILTYYTYNGETYPCISSHAGRWRRDGSEHNINNHQSHYYWNPCVSIIRCSYASLSLNIQRKTSIYLQLYSTSTHKNTCFIKARIKISNICNILYANTCRHVLILKKKNMCRNCSISLIQETGIPKEVRHLFF